MTELTGIGSAEAGNPNSGNGEASEGSDANAAATANAGPDNPGNLDWAKAKGWVDPEGKLISEKLAAGYRELETRQGKMIAMPDEKAKPEQVDEFHKKLGWPGDAKGYEFNVPKELPKDFVYDEATAGWFRETANELKLPKGVAAQLHDKFVTRMVEVQTQTASQLASQFEQELTTKAKSTHETLVKAWGEPGSPEYIQSRDAAIRAVKQDPDLKGLDDVLRETGLVTKDGIFTNPQIAIALSKIGRAMQNDTFVGIGKGGAEANPFAKGSINLVQQSQLVRTDPTTARAMMAAAGWDEDKIKGVLG